MSAYMEYVHEDTGTTARWWGGEYIEFGYVAEQNHGPRNDAGQWSYEVGDWVALDVINVWDHAKDEPASRARWKRWSRLSSTTWTRKGCCKMSRIILSRHDNGEEHVTVGWDRPLQHFFWSECDDKGESVDESYMDRGLVPTTVESFVNSAAINNPTVWRTIMEAVERGGKEGAPEVLVELVRHQALDYPESNITMDISTKEQR